MRMLTMSKPSDRSANRPLQIRATTRERLISPNSPSSHRPMPYQMSGMNGRHTRSDRMSLLGESISPIGTLNNIAGRLSTKAVVWATVNGLGGISDIGGKEEESTLHGVRCSPAEINKRRTTCARVKKIGNKGRNPILPY